MIPTEARLRGGDGAGRHRVVDFNEGFRFNPQGIDALNAQLRQVVYAATEFPSVRDVQVLIEGKRSAPSEPRDCASTRPLPRFIPADLGRLPRPGARTAPCAQEKEELPVALPAPDRRWHRLLGERPPRSRAPASRSKRIARSSPGAWTTPWKSVGARGIRTAVYQEDAPAAKGEAQDVRGRAPQGPEGKVGNGRVGDRSE